MKDELKRASAIMELASRIYVEAKGKVSGDQSIKLAIKFFDASDQFFAKVLHYIAEKEKEQPAESVPEDVPAVEVEPVAV